MARLIKVFPIIWKTSTLRPLSSGRFFPRILENPRWLWGCNDLTREMRNFDRTLLHMQEEMIRTHDRMWQEANRFWNNTAFGFEDSKNLENYIVEEDGVKKMKLQFDITGFKPEDIDIKTVNNKLIVHAKLNQKSDNHTLYQEYNREYDLPKGVDPLTVTSKWSDDGLLFVEAPYNPPEKESEEKPRIKEIPVKHE